MKKLSTLLTIAALLLGSAHPSALARTSGESSGGGDALVCLAPVSQLVMMSLTSPISYLFHAVRSAFGEDLGSYSAYFTEVYLADTFAHLQDNIGPDSGLALSRNKGNKEAILLASIMDAYALTPEEVEGFFIEVIAESDPTLAANVANKLKSLVFIAAEEVPELEDDGITDSQVPWNCRKKQLAVQDIEREVVTFNKDLFRQLSQLEKTLLRFHEAFIGLQTPADVAQSNTTELRKRVARLSEDPKLAEWTRKLAWSRDDAFHRMIYDILATWMKENELKAPSFDKIILQYWTGDVLGESVRNPYPRAPYFIHDALIAAGCEHGKQHLLNTSMSDYAYKTIPAFTRFLRKLYHCPVRTP